ncbi:MAG: RNA-directed DNA polymerase [bacterium]|uniref:RNA-directed DNA polymerase n=1 Tax=Candidatus Aphodosoma intestinipullorum TaxID=2840674 RepID=A0A940IE89_9BACT|nr:RNA-directed DNA polymerase [Candidatus Aphodosoma intestinipullorum]
MKEKSYSAYMDEITAEELYTGLLGHGLFADKLPAFLSSKEFCKRYPFNKKEGCKFGDIDACDYIRYESPRNTNAVRQLGIPNPFAYSNLCKSLADNWDRLKEKLKQNTGNDSHKVSRIHIRKMQGKDGLFEMNYEKRGDKEDVVMDMMTTARYEVHADISNCFSSIYSHSLPWVLVEKDTAKAKANDKKEWYNKIDKCVRSVKYGETNGLLIGPHASSLLSEIVLTAVDSKLSKKYKYIRHIDDYTCYATTYAEAEAFLTDLAKELREYDLTLNIKKTRIVELPTAAGEDWINQLNSFPSFHVRTYSESDSFLMDLTKELKEHDLSINIKKTKVEEQPPLIDEWSVPIYGFPSLSGRTKEKEIVLKRKEVKAFLDLALNLAQRKDDFAVITYAVKMLSPKSDDDDEKRKVKLDKSALSWYLSRMHHLLLAYPYLVHVADKCVLKMEGVGVEDIKKMGDDLYRVGKEKRLWEACSYALYWSIEHEYRPEAGCDDIAKEAVGSEDCIFMLLAYLRARKDGNETAKDKMVNEAKELCKNKKDFERYWLFVYEVYRFEGEELVGDKVAKNKLLEKFECLRKKHGISFIRKDFRKKCNNKIRKR